MTTIDAILPARILGVVRLPLLCRLGLHQWLYLPLTKMQQAALGDMIAGPEVRVLIGLDDLLTRLGRDAVCTRCFTTNAQVDAFIDALRKLRTP